MNNWYDTIRITRETISLSKLEKQASLDVSVLSANSYGELQISINGKVYNYRLPYSAEETGQDIQRAKGTKLSKWIKWLDQYRA